MSALLQLALNNENRLVSIFEVQTGIKCNCTCPECGEKLEAKNKGKTENTILSPNQKQAHFAHVSGKVCANAVETALHKMAKEILLEHKILMLPEYIQWGVHLRKPKAYIFDKVELEQIINHNEIKIIPDAVLTKGTKKLFVEFYKSHLVDRDKKEKLKSIGISAIEIDLNYVEPLKDGVPNIEGVKRYLELDSNFRVWLYNAERDRLFKEKEKESEIKPKYSLEFLKKQEEIYEQEIEDGKQMILERERISKIVEKWKEKAVLQGYELKKVYGYSYYTDETVYCPKEKKNENKKALSNCDTCPHFLNVYYSDDQNKFALCGFKANIVKR